jgi:hypothetical protein
MATHALPAEDSVLVVQHDVAAATELVSNAVTINSEAAAFPVFFKR